LPVGRLADRAALRVSGATDDGFFCPQVFGQGIENERKNT
jgi:hypothetical protein